MVGVVVEVEVVVEVGVVVENYLAKTAAIACYDMGFDLTGYEIDKDYYEAAVKRLENHKKQLTFI